ncbi:hypothetical protein GPALN_013215 [Globodera pallida]|nr:hypothetical protein GPALN_013215 [Globodera pallida]
MDANGGNSKTSARFGAMDNDELAAEICWNPGLNGWNAIRITEKYNGQMTFETSDSMALNADFGPVYEPFDEEFQNAQHFVTFLEDYGMSLRIFALDLASAGDADSSNWCKRTYLGTSACDDLGDDCEVTRDLVKQIRELEWCGEQRPETTIEQEEEDPLEDGGDISWTKGRAQQLYEELTKKCGLVSKVEEQKRPKRPFTYAQKIWEGYARVPVIFDIKNLGEDLAEWEEAIKNGMQFEMVKFD